MNPFGRLDKIEKDKRKKEKGEKKEENKIHENKKVWDAIIKTKVLVKENINMTEKLYDKLEKGELNKKDDKCEKDENNVLTLKKPYNIVNLKDKPNFDTPPCTRAIVI
jgi:hypothetical protein